MFSSPETNVLPLLVQTKLLDPGYIKPALHYNPGHQGESMPSYDNYDNDTTLVCHASMVVKNRLSQASGCSLLALSTLSRGRVDSFSVGAKKSGSRG